MSADAIDVARADPRCADARALMDELSDALAAITGSSGRASFDPDDVRSDAAVPLRILRAQSTA